MTPPTTLPDWVAALAASPTLATLGFHPLDEPGRQAETEAWLRTWDQVPFDDAFHATCRARIERAVPLLRGPGRSRTLSGQTAQMLTFFDPLRPDEAFVSLSPAMPSPLAPRTGITPEAFVAGLATYLRDGGGDCLGQAKTVRIVGRVEADLDQVERSLEALELWLDDTRWREACEDNPWLGVEAGSALAIARLRHQANRSYPGRLPSLAVTSLWSRSVLRLERHPFGEDAFELRYTPAEDTTTLRRFLDEYVPLPIPDDLPVDLAASLLRAALARTDLISQAFDDGQDADPMLVVLLAALAGGEPDTTRTLQRWIARHDGEEALLLEACKVFCAYNFLGLAWEVYGRIPESPRRDELGRWLMPTSLATGEVA